jgi:hypothetical protein
MPLPNYNGLPARYDLHTLTDHEYDVAVHTAEQLPLPPAPPPNIRCSITDGL